MLTAFLVLSSFYRPECSGYWRVRRGRHVFPMSCLCFSQIHSRSSCSEARSCGKPDLLRINSCSCTNPICWLRCHPFNWSRSMLLLQSASFVNLNASSLQNDAPLVSNKHLISIIGVYLKLSLRIMACCDERILLVTFLSGPLRNQYQTHYSIFELSKYSVISSKFQAFRTRFSLQYQIWLINYLIHEESQLWTNVSIMYLKMRPWSRAWFAY